MFGRECKSLGGTSRVAKMQIASGGGGKSGDNSIHNLARRLFNAPESLLHALGQGYVFFRDTARVMGG